MSELRHGSAHLLQRVQRSRGPVVVTQRGRPAAVLWSVREYEQAQHERQILLGLAKPVAAMQNDATVEEIVNMTSHVVLKAQQLKRDQVRA